METQAGDRAFRAVGASGTLEAREPLSWAKGSLGSLQESESLVEVTASIPGIRMLSPGFGEEREGRGHGEAALATRLGGRSCRAPLFHPASFPFDSPIPLILHVTRK